MQIDPTITHCSHLLEMNLLGIQLLAHYSHLQDSANIHTLVLDADKHIILGWLIPLA